MWKCRINMFPVFVILGALKLKEESEWGGAD